MSDATESLAVARSPYPGIRPFRRDESQLFFGRDEQIEAMLLRLHRSQFLAVVGTSGSGKSSLVKAGLIPVLEAGSLGSAGSEWCVADLRPGNSPLLNLARELLKCGILGEDWPNDEDTFNVSLGLLLARLRVGPRALVELLGTIKIPKLTNLLIIADQFEEIFRFYSDQSANEALKLVNLLMATAENRNVPAYVVLTMRSEYLGDCALFPGLPELLNDTQFLCPRLSRDQMTEAIEFPAKLFGGEVESGLASQMLNDVGANSDQLPLIQHCLARMWNSVPNTSSPRRLTLDHYRRMRLDSHAVESTEPGVFAALSHHADEILQDFREPDVLRMVERVFRALSMSGHQGQILRRSVCVHQIAEESALTSASDELERAESQVIRVVNAFRAEGHTFLMPSVDEVPVLTSDTMIDIGHESLLRQWKTLKGWLDAERQDLEMYRQITYHAKRWKSGQGMLWRPPLLNDAIDWREKLQPTEAWARRCNDAFAVCMGFIDACVGATRDARENLVHRHQSKPLWVWMSERLFGYDFFISYSWHDGRQYASALAKTLEFNGFIYFLDLEQYAAGDVWKSATKGALRRSLRMILIASPGALKSSNVMHELEVFQQTDRPLMPVIFDSILTNSDDSSVAQIISDYACIRDEIGNLAVGPPQRVLDEIITQFDTVKVSRRRKGLVLVVAALTGLTLAVMAVVATYQAHVAQVAASQATMARRAAVEALQQQIGAYTRPTSACGRIAALAAGHATNGTDTECLTDTKCLMVEEFAKLYSSEQPMVLTGGIRKQLGVLEAAIEKWEPNKLAATKEVTSAALAVAGAYRDAWQEQAKLLPEDAQKLMNSLIARPTYEVAVDVTRRLATDHARPEDLTAFEQLYWGELVLFETKEVEFAMVGIRKSLGEDKGNVAFAAGRLETAVNNALSELQGMNNEF
jgi:energy-coupling factor transporter ATP-binding protein EcfA2